MAERKIKKILNDGVPFMASPRTSIVVMVPTPRGSMAGYIMRCEGKAIIEQEDLSGIAPRLSKKIGNLTSSPT
jgi:hypothetical protein